MIALSSQQRVNQLLKEYFDSYGERKDLKTLNEKQENFVSNNLVSKLYEEAINKYKDIDFGEIPKTEGDISKLSSFKNMMESIELMSHISAKTNIPFEELNTLNTAISNIQLYKDSFEKGFKIKNGFIVSLYNVLVLSVVQATSYLISVSVEFVKNPSYESYEAVIKDFSKNKENLIIKNLKLFNESVSRKDLDKVMNTVFESNSKNFAGGGTLVMGASIAAASLILVPLMRELIFFFYHVRISLADFFKAQASFLKANSENVMNNKSLPADKKKKIIQNQKQAVDTLIKLSNMIDVKTKQGEMKTSSDIKSSRVQLQDIKSEMNGIDSGFIL